MRQAAATKYLYIVGRGNSGTTIFSILLGQSSAVASEGEIITGFRKGYEAKRCANQEMFCESAFWSRVKSDFEYRTGTRFADAVGLLYGRAHFTRAIPNLLEASDSASVLKAKHLTEALYDSIAEASGRPVVLDSSKEVATAVFLLRHVGALQLIHFVRSPFGVADSAIKKIRSVKQFYMFGRQFRVERYHIVPVIVTAVVWTLENLFCDMLRLSFPGRVIRIHYEDLYKQPTVSLQKLEKFTGISLAESKVAATDRAVLQPSHALQGNRLIRGARIVFAPELGLPRYLTLLDKTIVTLCTFPLLIAYGYFGQQGAMPPATTHPSPQ